MMPWAVRPDTLAAECRPGRYLLPPHIQHVSDVVSQAVHRGGARLAIHIPPRHGKSSLIAHWLPVWFLARNPQAKVVVASYDQELSALHSRAARDSFAEVGPQLCGYGVSEDAHAGAYWETDAGGSYKAVGVKTGFTGHGADLLVVDDPLKDAEEARSETIRNKHWDWWTGVASKRLEPGASVVVIMHRWNRDDLVGRLLADPTERFEYLRLPALADSPDDPLGRLEGEALWPERFPLEHWEPIRKRGAWDWSALCQGTPRSEEGQIFKREWLVNSRYSGEASGAVYQSWDLKTQQTTGGSYAVGLVAKYDGRVCRIVDRIKGRFGTLDSIRHIKAMQERWGRGPILIEAKAAGPSVIELLRCQVPGIVPINPGTMSKEVRAMGVQPFVADGSLGIPAGAGWRQDYEDELADFPLGSNDDQVDATTQLLAHLFLGHRRLHSLQPERLTATNPFAIR